MVKFSFFTVRSKCCKKSKFVVLFLFPFLLDLQFSNSIYNAFTFFFFASTLSTLITAVTHK